MTRPRPRLGFARLIWLGLGLLALFGRPAAAAALLDLGLCGGTRDCAVRLDADTRMSARPEGAAAIITAVGTNGDHFAPGQIFVPWLEVASAGVAAAADVYLGVRLPDADTVFFVTDGGIASTFGRLSAVTTFRPVAAAVSLAAPFHVEARGFFSYQWQGTEPSGTYVLFLALTIAGALADGILAPSELLALSTATFSFAPTPAGACPGGVDVGPTTATPSPVAPGRTETVQTRVCSGSAAADLLVQLDIFGDADLSIAQHIVGGQSFAAGEAKSYTWAYAVPTTLPAGTYRVAVSVLSGDRATVHAADRAAAAFQVGDRFGIRVYVLDFDPLMDDGRPLSVARGWNDPLALGEEYRSAVVAASAGVVDQAVVRTSVVRGYPPKEGGFTFTNAQYLGCLLDGSPTYCAALIDYARVLDTPYDQDFGSGCQALEQERVDEVWLWGGPWFGYLEYLLVPANTLCPAVARPFVVMGFNYERTVAEMLHDLGHRSEALIQAGIGFTLWDRFDGQRGRYAQDFECPAQPDAAHPEVDAAAAGAGNVHFPPNGYCHYQYDREYPVLSDADDWANFPDLTGRRTPVDARTWGGTEHGFLVWWMGRFPRSPGTTQGIEHNWWRYVFPSARR